MKFRISPIVSAVALGIGLSAVAQADNHPIVIGVQVPTTGSEATYGQDMLNAAEIAAAEINAQGGVLGRDIELINGDSACDPQQSVNAAGSLVSRDVLGIVGGYCSGATLPTLKTYGDEGLPFVITASNSTQLIPANPGNAFMINSTGADQSKKAADFFASEGVENLVIIDQGDSYSQDLADLTAERWEAMGGEYSRETVNKGEQDFSSVVSKVRSSGADAVLWTAYYADGGLMIRQLRQGGYRGMIAVGDGSNSPQLFDIAGGAAEGVFAFSNPTAKFLPEAAGFIETYRSEYGNEPGPYAPMNYDGLKLLAWAMEKAGTTDSDAVIDVLESTDGESWLTGPISFTDENTLARSNFIILRGEDNAWSFHAN
ncbi:MAG: branched-chain amino acid ABC transporter substrate-binding protein [Spiribacter sp.]|nr:branched-chain amino acid ABC transporter substrate-binding protein [Spiribacter sp.]MDR9488726.1 branched-chain amino acid ABC transporter substrate-binding protein [Spiribacter sp.]